MLWLVYGVYLYVYRLYEMVENVFHISNNILNEYIKQFTNNVLYNYSIIFIILVYIQVARIYFRVSF